MKLVVRLVKWEDFEDVIENYYSFYEEFKTDSSIGLVFRKNPPNINSEIAWFSNMIVSQNRGEAIAVVAEYSGKVVGLCDVYSKRPNSELSHIGSLGITVKKEYRHMGIGTLLMKKAIKLSKRKFDVLVLDVFETNDIAIHLYEKLGFKKYAYLPRGIKRKGEYIGTFSMFLDL
ncbi:MAG: GNAT family N-acetyltransferase [Thermoplasmata archaeon]